MPPKINKQFILVIFVSICSFQSVFSAGTVIKMLAIGNSFSEDALEAYVANLAQADGVQVVVGNLYWGGCDLATHWNNAITNNTGYSYRKIVVDADGVLTKTTRATTSIQYAVQDDNWDYITFQQVSQHSGKYSTFFPYLTDLKQYVNNLKTNPDVKYAIHRTWAYAANSTHSEYNYYHSNQREMYDSIEIANSKASVRAGIELIIPTGTAIQNARSSYIGDNFNRDGYHLSYGLGRYTVACAWYEKIVGKLVIGNTFIPVGVSAVEAGLAQNAAHYAITTPGSITSMADYVVPPVIDPATLTNDINIDFGDKTTALTNWNNLTACSLNSSIISLKDAAGNSTAISITVNDAFNSINQSGATTTTTSLNLPVNASIDCFYGNGTGLWSGFAEPTGGFLLAGLLPNQQFDIYMFGSRAGTTDNRETYYTISGDKNETLYLDCSNNSTNVVSVKQMKAKTDGTINIIVGAGPNNNQTNQFFYINAMIIKPAALTSVQSISNSTFRFYPNPVKYSANLEATEKLKSVIVYDLMGRKVLEFNDINLGKSTIDLSTLKNGCYVIKHENECTHFIKNASL